jgi:hypothetical protein
MYPLKKILSLSIGLAVLGMVAVLIGTGTVGASPSLVPIAAAPPTPSIPVTVTNSSVPVSGNVGINGTPTVNATVGNTVAVTGSVGISNTPAVTLSNNGYLNPVYVETEANPAYFVQEGTCSVNSSLNTALNSQTNCASFTAGGFAVTSRLAVQNMSIAVQVPAGTIVQNAYIGISQGLGGVSPLNFTPMTKMSSDATSDYYVGTADVHLYYATNQPLGCGITASPNPSSNATTPLNIQCTINGHLVPGIAD